MAWTHQHTLYRMRNGLPKDDAVSARVAGIEPDKIYWLMSSRSTTLGSIGWFASTYENSLGTSPGNTVCKNLPMRYMEAA